MAEDLPPLPKGKFFYIVGRESGLVLEIQDANLEPGTPVVLGEKRDIREAPVESLCQMWYNCLVTGTIRCRANANLAFTINDDDQLVVDIVAEEDGTYRPTECQKWYFSAQKDVIRGTMHGEPRLLDVADHATDPGSPLIVNEETREDNQLFNAEQLDSPYFMLVSELGGMCMEVDTGIFGGVKEDLKIVISKRDGKDNQLWFEDTDGIIRTKAGNFAIQCEKEPGAALRTAAYSRPRPIQHWHCMPNNTIQNRNKTGYVLDIAQRKNKDGAKVVVWEYNGGANQKWRRDFDLPTKAKKAKAKKTKKTSKSKAEAADDDDEDTPDEDQK